ncbi:MAG: type II and III secretion system protein family protein [Sulfuricella sp.]|nr:type II and III secretion system protein family protein [Sulfuricella sp.]
MITSNNKGETMMNEHKIINSRLWQYGGKLLAAALGIALIAAPLQAAEPAKVEVAKAEPAKTTPAKKKPAKTTAKKAPATVPGVTARPSLVPPASTIEFAPQVGVTVGKSTLLKLPAPAARISVGNPAVADVILLNPSEVYLLGKTVGSTNVILWSKTGHSTVVDVIVGMDTAALQGKLQQLLPGEKNIKVAVAADSLVLTGTLTDAVMVDKAVALAEAYSGKKVVNFLQAGAPQQVMLEVKVAEVSKTLSDKLGAAFKYGTVSGSWTYTLLAGFLTGNAAGTVAGPASVSAVNAGGLKSLTLDAAKTDGLVKILAEPNIMAMSGQEGAFLAGGKIYIPVPQSGVGGTTITLEEKEFGVGLRFTPTVLEGGLINLKVSPEVSELGKNVTVGSQTIPSITTRRASTTVQLHDGQSFAIGGLIKSNVTETMAAFPGLGEIPILGALFRSSDFQNERTELLFIITPRLVKPLPPNYALPTDAFIEPTRGEFFLEGKLEGAPKTESQPAAAPAEPKPQAPATGGFQMK